MAAFSCQHQHLAILADEFQPNPNTRNDVSGLLPEQETIAIGPFVFPYLTHEFLQETTLHAERILETIHGDENVSEKVHLTSSINYSSATVQRESKREKLPKSSVSRKLESVNPTKRQKTVPPAELPAGYVHVRARRGEATDSHSLAERARREKISAKMRLLQSLVPGCDGITGKAHILDEIIRHVQSLKDRVEELYFSSELQFLSDQEPGSSQVSPLGEISDAPTSLLQPQLTYFHEKAF
ncbi:hypothetical protein OIU84_023800 [Salix udensis]|uniref:BHLH domain-containing protein n=1 Tax=Salix udensis TaxID=889485 RepID=A0AAD6PGQ0_9ROSI|nr:hypothetical protein OIU84_023800 [Salix udensis]